MITADNIRSGLAQGDFFLEYLPTVSLITGKCTGAEALIRWRTPQGVLPPLEFIPFTENTPLSGLITYWVIDTLAMELGDWLRANPDAHISINVPPEILGRGGMEYVASKSGLLDLASQLILEITERGVPDLMGVEAINDIWGLGVRVALDDLTLDGGANLAILARCHFHIAKLDCSLVSQITDESPFPDWLQDISAIQNTSSRLTLIAEGIETEVQLNALKQANIHEVQGYIFSKSLPAQAFIDFHRDFFYPL